MYVFLYGRKQTPQIHQIHHRAPAKMETKRRAAWVKHELEVSKYAATIQTR